VLASFPANARIFVSFDLDSVRGADAPGVSCPGAIGLSSDDALRICLAAGEDPRVCLFDLSEFNPTIEAYRTGKLVAAMFYYFLLGLKKRKSKIL
jgi:formiminoglutamase